MSNLNDNPLKKDNKKVHLKCSLVATSKLALEKLLEDMDALVDQVMLFTELKVELKILRALLRCGPLWFHQKMLVGFLCGSAGVHTSLPAPRSAAELKTIRHCHLAVRKLPPDQLNAAALELRRKTVAKCDQVIGQIDLALEALRAAFKELEVLAEAARQLSD